MGKVLGFPAPNRNTGIVHVYAMESGGFEISHESASGNSWGSFEQFNSAQDAVASAYRLNRDVYANECEVHLSAQVLAALLDTSAPSRGEF